MVPCGFPPPRFFLFLPWFYVPKGPAGLHRSGPLFKIIQSKKRRLVWIFFLSKQNVLVSFTRKDFS